MNIRIEKLAAVEADNERLRTSLVSEEKKSAKIAVTVRELKKELTRSKAQLEGVQDQVASSQLRIHDYYQTEIKSLREELESLGVHVKPATAAPRALPRNEDEEDDELNDVGAFSDTESAGGEENDPDPDGLDDEGTGRGRGTSWGRIFRGNEKEKRERRLSDALDMLPG